MATYSRYHYALHHVPRLHENRALAKMISIAFIAMILLLAAYILNSLYIGYERGNRVPITDTLAERTVIHEPLTVARQSLESPKFINNRILR